MDRVIFKEFSGNFIKGLSSEKVRRVLIDNLVFLGKLIMNSEEIGYM